MKMNNLTNLRRATNNGSIQKGKAGYDNKFFNDNTNKFIQMEKMEEGRMDRIEKGKGLDVTNVNNGKGGCKCMIFLGLIFLLAGAIIVGALFGSGKFKIIKDYSKGINPSLAVNSESSSANITITPAPIVYGKIKPTEKPKAVNIAQILENAKSVGGEVADIITVNKNPPPPPLDPQPPNTTTTVPTNNTTALPVNGTTMVPLNGTTNLPLDGTTTVSITDSTTL